MRSTTTSGADHEDISGTLIQSEVPLRNMKSISLMEAAVITVQEVALQPHEIYRHDRSGQTSFIHYKKTITPRTYIPSPYLYQYGNEKYYLWSS